MSTAQPRWNDQRIEVIIGFLLRAGVVVAAVLVTMGGGVYLARHGQEAPAHHVFRGEPHAWSTLSGILSESTLKHGQAIIMTGLLVLILTPVARVAFSLAAFALEHDWLYVAITTLVLAVLIFSLFSSGRP